MSWLSSFLIAFLNAAVGGFGACVLGSLCAAWYRVPSREGQSGYFIIFFGLLGIVGGFIVGMVAARIVAAGAAPGFLKGLGYATGSSIGLLALIAGFSWFAADLPPTIGGRGLVVEFEVRCPPGFQMPGVETNVDDWTVYVTADHGSRIQRSGQLRIKEAKQVEGRWIIPATVDLATSDSGKSIGVSIPERETQFYNFPLPGKPGKRDMEWSAWLPGPTFGELAKIRPEDFLAVRYRVQFYVPPPPPPSETEIRESEQQKEEKAFAALSPESSIGEWLAFTKYGAPEARVQAVFAAIAVRPNFLAEYAEQIRSDDREAADRAQRGLEKMKSPPPELGAAVVDVGRQIVEDIRAVNATTGEEDSATRRREAALSVRFSGWSLAAFAMHGKPGVDLLPLMTEIQQLATVRGESYVMKQDVLRVATYYVEAWSGAARAKAATSP